MFGRICFQRNDEETFSAICRYAIANDIDQLKEVIKAQPECINWSREGILDFSTPVMLLAEQAEDNAVLFLMTHFGISPSDAVEGYARVLRVDKVDELIEQGASIHHALRGYAFANADDEVNDLMDIGGHVSYAIMGYAHAGNVNRVWSMFQRAGGYQYRNDAIPGLVASGQVAAVEELIQLDCLLYYNAELGLAANPIQKSLITLQHRYRKPDFDAEGSTSSLAMFWYGCMGYYNDSSLALRMFAMTEDPELREWMAVQAGGELPKRFKKKAAPDNIMALCQKGAVINTIMRRYQLDFRHAQKLLIPGLRVWILQGRGERLSRYRMPYDLFMRIIAYIIELPIQDAAAIVASVCKNTHDAAVRRLSSKKFSLFAKQDVSLRNDKLAELEKRYNGHDCRVGIGQ